MSKSLLITGAGKGIGLASAQYMREKGYRVFTTTRSEHDVQLLLQQGFEALKLDITDSDSIKNALAQVLEKTGGTLDALFNNAGFGQPGAVEDLSRDLMRKQFETNVFGTMEMTNAVIPIMRKQGYGKIITVSSILGIISMRYQGAYVASKFAVEGFMDTLRLELHDSPIQVVLIEPGPIISEFRASALTAYQQGIDPSRSAHEATYKKITESRNTERKDPVTLPPVAVAKKLYKALESKRPKARYYVTVPAHVLPILKKILPTRAMDWICRQIPI